MWRFLRHRFHLSTRKSSFTSAFSGVLVWMIDENVSQNSVLKWQRINVDPASHRSDHAVACLSKAKVYLHMQTRYTT